MLTVLSVGFPLAPISENTAGGAEHILRILDDALVAAGHRSLVVAAEGSHCSGELVAIPNPGPALDAAAWAQTHVHCRRILASALKEHAVDLVHFHGIDFMAYLPETPVPTIVTLHLAPQSFPSYALNQRPNTFFVCVSRSQAAACPKALPVTVIENGIPTHEFCVRHKKWNYALALGRICPEKGFHLALEAATAAGVPLVIGGEVFGYPEHQMYFHKEILPRMGNMHRFIGPVGGRRKKRLLAGASCLLVPSLADETSSLVTMEALASGTPVVAFKRGALPELIKDGHTGYLVNNVAEMSAAIPRCASMRPIDCRRAAEERFSSKDMVAQYFRLYDNVLNAQDSCHHQEVLV